MRINAVRSPYKRSPWYYHAARFEVGKDNVFTECDNDRHDARRRKMLSGVSPTLIAFVAFARNHSTALPPGHMLTRADTCQYSGKENPTLEPSIDVHVKELVDLVRKYASSPASIDPPTHMDLAQKIPFFTLDVISHIGLGEAFGDLTADHDVKDYLKSSEEGLKIGNTAFAMGIAWLKEMPIIGPAISPSEKDTTGFGNMMAQARKIIVSRSQKSTEEKSDMFAAFVRHGLAGDELCE